MSDLKTATSAIPKVLVSQYLPNPTEAAQYTVIAGVTTKLSSVALINTDSSAHTATVSVVKSGDTAGGSNRIYPTVSLAAGAVANLGQFVLGPGDFISGVASVASKVVIIITGIEFSSTTVGVATGIQDDAIGTGGRTAASSTVTGTNVIGTGSNRYLLAALLAEANTGTVTYSSYSTLTLSCTDGAMTRLVSCDFNSGGTLTGSVHIFGRANPSSASSQSLTGTVVSSGTTFNLTVASMSLSGIASTSGAATSGPSSAAVPSLAVTSAINNRAFFAGGMNAVPQDFNQRVRAFNGNGASALAVPHWLLFADALGAATVTATSSNSQPHAIVGINLVPA